MQYNFDIITSPELSAHFAQARLYGSVDSTNTEARRYAVSGGKVPALFVADTQTGGRGRMGRSFYSPLETGIYMTLLFDVTSESPSDTVALTTAAAVAVTGVIERYTGVAAQIKWVNDILVNGKKVCGILAESFFCDGKRYAAVGVGVNLCTHSFPEELKDIAGSLLADRVDGIRERMTVDLALELYDIYGKAVGGDRSYMDIYRARSAVLGKRVTYLENGISEVGVATAIYDSGALEITFDNGEKKLLASGEISLRLGG